MKEKFDADLTFGQKVPKLNSRPVYCSRLYGIHSWAIRLTVVLQTTSCFFGSSILVRRLVIVRRAVYMGELRNNTTSIGTITKKNGFF